LFVLEDVATLNT